MKKMLILIFFTICVNAQDFENKYYKCVLIENNGSVISERMAETLDAADVSLVIKKTSLTYGQKYLDSNKYLRTLKRDGMDVDVYGYGGERFTDLYKNVSFDESNMRFYVIDTYLKKQEVYSCNKASFFEKALIMGLEIQQ